MSRFGRGGRDCCFASGFSCFAAQPELAGVLSGEPDPAIDGGLASCGPEPAGTGNAAIENVGSPGGGLVAAIAGDDAVADAADDAVDDAVVVGAVEAADVVARTASATLTASLAAGPVGAPLGVSSAVHPSEAEDETLTS